MGWSRYGYYMCKQTETIIHSVPSFFNMGRLKQGTPRYLRRATPVSNLVPERRDGGNLL
ncbi:hypothetical protein BDV33DRAFT_180430, partial [Aspergillus novoparasiticus]